MNNYNQENVPDPWLQYMRQGNFNAAWNRNDVVLNSRNGEPCWHLPRHFQYIWNGTQLHNKRVLIRCYHGLGDTIQFIRYAPLVKSVAREVVVWAQDKLMPLLETVEGIDEIIPLHDGTPQTTYDVDVEIMELPHIFRTTLDTIPAKFPYLHVEPTRLFLDDNQFKVGLVWRSGDWDARRSMPFLSLYPLAAIPRISFHILQPGAIEAGWKEEFGVYHGEFMPFEYAALIKGLDLFITIDSMPAHLAGALGIPVWTLLNASADWRWMEDREESPWYPTMRLFRQQQAGNWESVIERVVAELKIVSGKL